MKLYSLGWAAIAAVLLLASAGYGVVSTNGQHDGQGEGADVAPAALDALSIDWGATDVRVSDLGALFPGGEKNQFEPSIAIDPTDPDTVLAFWLDFSVQNVNPDGWSIVRGARSTDGGATWTQLGVLDYDPQTADVWDSGDPVVQFAHDGTAYLATLGYTPGESRSVYVHRSLDGGATWHVLAQPVRPIDDPVMCGSPDKEWLAVQGQSLYLTWTEFAQPCATIDPIVGLDGVLQGSVRLGFTQSHDGGATWDEPQFLDEGWAFGQPDVGPDGTIHVAYWTSSETPLAPCPSALSVVATRTEPFSAIGVASSRDGGATWSYHRVGACSLPELSDAIKPGRAAGGNFQAALAVDPITGAAHVAYPTFVGQRYTIEVMTSSDRGLSWSEPMDATPSLLDHASLPAIIAEGGHVGLSYQLGRIDGTGDAAFVRSTDGGATWSDATILSSAPSQLGRLPDVGPERDPHTGDYWHIDLASGRIAAIWADARNADPVEIYARVGVLS